MGLSDELEKLKFDKRLMEWHVNRRLVTKEELDKYLNSLPDLSGNVEPFSLGEEVSNNQAPSAQVESQPQSPQQ